MMHSILLSSSVSVFFVVVLVLTTLTIDQSVQGLALPGIVRRVVKNNSSNISIWGKRNSRSQQQRSSELPAMRKVGGVATTIGNTITSSTSNTQQVAPSISTTAAAAEGLLSSPYIPFDADLYRQEMTDIVYQRNMERMDL